MTVTGKVASYLLREDDARVGRGTRRPPEAGYAFAPSESDGRRLPREIRWSLLQHLLAGALIQSPESRCLVGGQAKTGDVLEPSRIRYEV